MNAGKAMRDHVDTEDRQTLANLGGSKTDPPLEYNDALLYALMMRSKKREVKLLQRWVTNEVLASPVRQCVVPGCANALPDLRAVASPRLCASASSRMCARMCQCLA